MQMREILFRGKKNNNKWVKGRLITDDVIAPEGQRFVRDTDGSFNIKCQTIDPKTVGEFTGLTDKNGVKIFEGDIIIYDDGEDADREGEFSIVVWENAEFCLKHFTANCEPYYDDCNLTHSSCYYEIIGNIHDNPELLGGNDI